MMNQNDLEDLRSDFARAINRVSGESASNTPDFILADYLIGCLQAFNATMQKRRLWYGVDDKPGAEGSMSELQATGNSSSPEPVVSAEAKTP